MTWRRSRSVAHSMKTFQPKFNPYLLPHERAAQGMEAEGGDSEAGSVHDSPVPAGNAPQTSEENHD